MPITSTIARLPKVSDSQKESMFLLHSKYFCNVDRKTFFDDMNEKDWIIILQKEQAIVGFSTLKVIRISVDNVERIYLFSGDTIVDPAYWQESKLAGSFGHFMLRLLIEHKDKSLYWFLISKGYRTYRFLPVYFKRFYPVFDHATPHEYTNLIHAVASYKFNGSYDGQTGLIRHGGQKDRLKAEMCVVPESRRSDPHVRFFLEKNPGYHLGDELACIADISEGNFNTYARRVIKSTTVVWDE
jgi:hypothetical protein